MTLLARGRALLLRAVAAGAGSAALTGLAALGMLLTTEGRAANLLLEPLCLLFLPGLVLAMGWTVVAGHLHRHPKTFQDNHDFSATLVVEFTFFAYFAWLFWLQRRRGRAASHALAADSR